MKFNFKLLAKLTLLSTTGLFALSSFAVTEPTEITRFTPKKNNAMFSSTSKGWSDPKFGNEGWTHSSDWGSFWAKAGQTVTIKVVSETLGLHPGVSVWRRGAQDTAADNYVVHHFYSQNKNFVKMGGVDEATDLPVGNIVMRIKAFGYDQDNNSLVSESLNGIEDGVPGQLVLTFKVPRTGLHQFVVGGINPDAGVDVDTGPKGIRYNFDVTVTVTP